MHFLIIKIPNKPIGKIIHEILALKILGKVLQKSIYF